MYIQVNCDSSDVKQFNLTDSNYIDLTKFTVIERATLFYTIYM